VGYRPHHLLLVGALLCGSCRQRQAPGAAPASAAPVVASPEWALVIHGGAGGRPSQASAAGYRAGLAAGLEAGKVVLATGGRSLDAVEATLRVLEDDPRFNAGKGAVFNHAGGHDLDASIMDGKTLACGAVAGVTRVRHPASLARQVMEKTRHVLLAGPGADAFAAEIGMEPVDNAWFSTAPRRAQWEKARQSGRTAWDKGTVGAVALDRHGDLAAGTSTGGLTAKRFGRVGDSPIVGAGTYADNRTCAVSCTGIGEEFIRRAVAHDVSAGMAWGGLSLAQAANRVVRDKLPDKAGGLIGLARDGSAVAVYNTDGMLWARADASGRSEVHIPDSPPWPR